MARNNVMTEAEWLSTSDITPMLDFLRESQVSERKMRLLACACCRSVWEHLPDPRSRRAVEVAERYADDLATPKELAVARNSAVSVNGGAAWAAYWATNVRAGGPLWNTFAAASQASARKLTRQTQKMATWLAAQAESVRAQVELIREVMGNPFQAPSLDPYCLAWEDGTIVHLARGIYDEQAFERLPFLGDALEEAGCTDARVFEHCRQDGFHVRGCWVVDLILGKT